MTNSAIEQALDKVKVSVADRPPFGAGARLSATDVNQWLISKIHAAYNDLRRAAFFEAADLLDDEADQMIELSDGEALHHGADCLRRWGSK